MRRTLASFILVAGLVAFSHAAEARAVLLGPRLSLDIDDDFDDDSDIALGAELRIELATIGRNVGMQLRPSFDFYFIDNVDLFNLSLDFLFVFNVSSSVEPYAGAGLGIFFWDPDGPGDGGSEAGLDLVGGVKFLP